MVIRSIKKIKLHKPVKVYDLQVSSEDEQTFICEGVVVHNSAICINYDGRAWYYSEKSIPENARLLPAAIMPPAHFRCRSCTVPITKSWKELGINISEAPEGTRSALDGYVPQSMTYAEWFDKASADVQKEVLGAAKYEMYKKGDMKITQFINDGSWLSLEQLKQKGY